MSWEFILGWLAIIVAVEALTELIVDSKIMFPIRDWFGKPPPTCPDTFPDSKCDGHCKACASGKFAKFRGKVRNKVGELLNCGYCTSVWVALLAAYFVSVNNSWPIYIVKVLIIHRLSNMIHELFKKWLNRAPLNVVLTHIHHERTNDGS